MSLENFVAKFVATILTNFTCFHQNARPRACTDLLTQKNLKSWQILGRCWQKLGRQKTWQKLGRSWQILGRCWQKLGRQKTWQKLGRTWQKLGRYEKLRRFRRLNDAINRNNL